MDVVTKKKFLLILLLMFRRKIRRRRLMNERMMVGQFFMSNTVNTVHECNKIAKILRFYKETVPQMTPRFFRRHFRMYKEGLKSVTNYLSHLPIIKEYQETTRVSLGKQVAMTMAYLGSKSTTVSLAHLFGISEERFLNITDKVMDGLICNIQNIISWPQRQHFRYIANKFNNIGKHYFPNVIGAIDGCHLEIELTEEKMNQDSYSNYHNYHSMVLQATCTYDLSFIFIQAGWPGRANDAGIFNKSSSKEKLDCLLEDNARDLANSFHIVGDSAFPLHKSLMVPYDGIMGDNVDRIRSFFNKCLSSKRQNIERAFSLLLRRFPRLYKLNQKSLRKKMKVIMSACVLHNMCIWEKDNINYFLRTALRNSYVRARRIDTSQFDEIQSKLDGQRKRNIICARLYNEFDEDSD